MILTDNKHSFTCIVCFHDGCWFLLILSQQIFFCLFLICFISWRRNRWRKLWKHEICITTYTKNMKKTLQEQRECNTLHFWPKQKKRTLHKILWDGTHNNFSEISPIYWIQIFLEGVNRPFFFFDWLKDGLST